MNAIELLEHQHRQMERLFAQLEHCPPDHCAELFGRLADLIDAHADMEEQIFYPAARGEGCDDLLDKSLEAHAEFARLTEDMRHLSGSDARFWAKCALLREHVESHVREEEFELLPACERFLPAVRLEQLGQQMQAQFEMAAGDLRRFEVELTEPGIEVEWEGGPPEPHRYVPRNSRPV